MNTYEMYDNCEKAQKTVEEYKSDLKSMVCILKYVENLGEQKELNKNNRYFQILKMIGDIIRKCDELLENCSGLYQDITGHMEILDEFIKEFIL